VSFTRNVTVKRATLPSCECECGCAYQLSSTVSHETKRCFSCRAYIHAGRKKGWMPGGPPSRPQVIITEDPA
jgi:hypothetical protein